MGLWICYNCGSENPDSLNECEVCLTSQNESKIATEQKILLDSITEIHNSETMSALVAKFTADLTAAKLSRDIPPKEAKRILQEVLLLVDKVIALEEKMKLYIEKYESIEYISPLIQLPDWTADSKYIINRADRNINEAIAIRDKAIEDEKKIRKKAFRKSPIKYLLKKI